MKVHFLGIGGSGMSGVALLAKKFGFEVTGCDAEAQTAYLSKLKDEDIQVYQNHSSDHLHNVDLLAVSPAVFYQNSEIDEVVQAKLANKLLTWQKFLGEYLQKNKKVICVAGTHGKSTTSAMLALMLEQSGLDPLAMIGATVKSWNANSRFGEGEYFVTEADEFYDNFLNYIPDTIILNNIEFDHPDYFSDERQLFESFDQFVNKLTGSRTLIYNQDDLGAKKLISKLDRQFQLVGYSLDEVEDLNLGEKKTTFKYKNHNFELAIPGKHNVLNVLGVINFALINQIPLKMVEESLSKFKGVGRRLELLGEKNGVLVYDDYAHHPTAIKATLAALKQKYPDKKIIAVVEPHTFSRTKALLDLYKDAFDDADDVLITPIFKSRDKENFGITEQSIVDVVGEKAKAFSDFEPIVDWIKNNVQSNEVVTVMGAGKSYELSKKLLT